MTTNNSTPTPRENDEDDRDEQPTIVHETIPGDAPIVKDGGGDAKEKAGTSTADEDI
jgi:hypothetical protein